MPISRRYVPSQFLGDKTTTEKFRDGMKEENFGPTRWHECVSAVITSCLEETQCTEEDLVDAAASMPFLTDVKGALTEINKNKSDKQCGQAIISDGNDLFIGAFLKRNEMEDYFTHGIETNTGSWELENESLDTNCSKKLKVKYQSAKFGGHSCTSCPPNLCKSQALSDIIDRTEQSRPRIVYVGDGSNDACPALHVLREGDILLARCGKRRRDPNSISGPTADGDSTEGHGEHNFHPEMHVDEFEAHVAGAFPILSAIRKAKVNYGIEPRCKVYAWRSGKQLRSLITQILDGTLNEKKQG